MQIPSITGGASAASSESFSGGTTFGAVNFSQDSGLKWVVVALLAAAAFVYTRK